MTTATHPLYSNHTHSIQVKLPDGNNITAYNYTACGVKSCPLGHTRCQLTTQATVQVARCTISTVNFTDIQWLTEAEIAYLVVNFGLSSAYTYALGAHIHTHNAIDIDSAESDVSVIIYGTGTVCGSDGGKYTSRGAYLSAPPTQEVNYDAMIGAGSLSGSVNFRVRNANIVHSHIQPMNSNSPYLTSAGVCASGHVDCAASYTTASGEDGICYAATTSNGSTSSSYPSATVTTLDATGISYGLATLNGIADVGIDWVCFQYGTESGNLIYSTYPQAYTSPFSQQLSNLVPNTAYYFRAIGLVGLNTIVYGDELYFTTSSISSPRGYTLIQQDYRGRPIFLAECKAIDSIYTGVVYETQYTNNGIATFVNLPNDRPVDIEVRWGKQYRKYYNVYEATGDELVGVLASSHEQNTDAIVNGVRITLPASPALGEIYLG